MGHDHFHESGHAHSAGSRNKGRLRLVLGLTGSYMVVEVIAGLMTNSLALLAEAAHMFTDVAAVALALFAIRFAERPATSKRTYGYHRVEILAALANGVLLVSLSGLILFEAIHRLDNPPEVQGKAMFLVAIVGLIINGIGIFVLQAGAAESLNVKAAYFEVMSDAISAFGVILAGAIVWRTGWYYADPLVSAGIGLFILPRTWALLSEAVGVLLEGTPAHIDLDAVRKAMEGVPGVTTVHDLHVWTITSGMHALSAHAGVVSGSSQAAALEALRQRVESDFKITHVTIQMEESPCGDSGGHA